MLKDCDCIVDYHLGKAYVVIDALSRKIIYVLSLKHYIWRFASNRALLAQLKAMPYLKKMMIDAEKNDVKLQKMVQLVENGDKNDYSKKKIWRSLL